MGPENKRYHFFAGNKGTQWLSVAIPTVQILIFACHSFRLKMELRVLILAQIVTVIFFQSQTKVAVQDTLHRETSFHRVVLKMTLKPLYRWTSLLRLALRHQTLRHSPAHCFLQLEQSGTTAQPESTVWNPIILRKKQLKVRHMIICCLDQFFLRFSPAVIYWGPQAPRYGPAF